MTQPLSANKIKMFHLLDAIGEKCTDFDFRNDVDVDKIIAVEHSLLNYGMVAAFNENVETVLSRSKVKVELYTGIDTVIPLLTEHEIELLFDVLHAAVANMQAVTGAHKPINAVMGLILQEIVHAHTERHSQNWQDYPETDLRGILNYPDKTKLPADVQSALGIYKSLFHKRRELTDISKKEFKNAEHTLVTAALDLVDGKF